MPAPAWGHSAGELFRDHAQPTSTAQITFPNCVIAHTRISRVRLLVEHRWSDDHHPEEMTMTKLKIAVIAALLIASVPAFAQRVTGPSTAPAAHTLDSGPYENMSRPE